MALLLEPDRGFDHAAEVYSEQHASDPSFRIEEQQLIGWADALSNIGNFKDAIAILKSTVSIYPDSWLAYGDLGDTYRAMGDTVTTKQIDDFVQELF